MEKKGLNQYPRIFWRPEITVCSAPAVGEVTKERETVQDPFCILTRKA